MMRTGEALGNRKGRAARRAAWGLGLVAILAIALVVALPVLLLRQARDQALEGARAAMPFASVTIPGRDGGTLNAWLAPTLEPWAVLILVPGSGGAQATAATAALADDLSGRNYAVLVLDVRGQGGSPPARALAAGEGDDVLAAVDFLKARSAGVRVGAVGFGLGGLAVLDAAARDPRIESVVAIDPPRDPLAPLDALLQDQALPDLLRAPVRAAAQAVWGFGTLASPAEALPRLERRPVLLAWPAADEAAQLDGRALAARASAGLFQALPPRRAEAGSGWDADYRNDRTSLVEHIANFLDDTFAIRFG
ncbi:alpha/beta hydrolase family protein [Zavarzinia sp. CC-PAN008]|uniref:alpha/beta hydrolase family protein n=1 Tax=Zavarzinia sp. CC-PAN008 TaxID=3243332 RepID=UPI003F7490CA